MEKEKMYAKTNKTNKMNNYINKKINITNGFNNNNNSSSASAESNHNDFYYQKERNEYLRKLALQKTFFFNRM